MDQARGARSESQDEALLSVRIPVAAHITGLSRSKLYELIKAGTLKTSKVGKATLVMVDDLRDLLARHRR
ncbi:MAG: excisionase [Sphingobium sp.]|nr:excisionase [Sphingobium sp.]